MISGSSAGSSSSSTARIGLILLPSGAASERPTTNPVFRFAPNGTSTREPRRTASRSSGGIAYVNVPCTATGTATSANSERPDGIGRYCLRRSSAIATNAAIAMYTAASGARMRVRGSGAKLISYAQLSCDAGNDLHAGGDHAAVAVDAANADHGVIEIDRGKHLPRVRGYVLEAIEEETLLAEDLAVQIFDGDDDRQRRARRLDHVQLVLRVARAVAVQHGGLAVADAEARRGCR